jgi:glucose-1-phosphate adenylyltransferase
MGILCQHRPKPNLPFAGIARVIDFTLSNCIHSEITDIAVLTDYQRTNLTTYLSGWRCRNVGSHGIRILEPSNGSYLGTADAVYQSTGYLEQTSSDLVLVLAGDHIYQMDYRKMLVYHRQRGADVTVAVISVPIEQARRFGVVTTDDGGQITDFVEKPELPQGNLVSMGIYVFDKQTLVERLIEDAALPHSPHDFGHAVLPYMVERDRVVAYEYHGYWKDIGTPQAYYEANMELLHLGLFSWF